MLFFPSPNIYRRVNCFKGGFKTFGEGWWNFNSFYTITELRCITKMFGVRLIAFALKVSLT